MPRILGLDLSFSRTGWAIGSTDCARPVWGRIAFAGDDGLRIRKYRAFVVELHCRYHFDEIAFEEIKHIVNPFERSAASEGTRFQLYGATHCIAGELDLPAHGIPLSAWRKRFLGFAKKPNWISGSNGDFLKQQAIAVCERRGWTVKDHNEAEALGVMDFWLCEKSPDYAAQSLVMQMGAGQTNAGAQ